MASDTRDPLAGSAPTADAQRGSAPTVEPTLAATPGLGLEGTLPAAAGGPAVELPLVDPDCYHVIAEHARGGLGRILLARDKRTDRRVAIKEMLRGTPDAALRFHREAMITARLQHPAIVPVYEVGRWPSGEPFYAMKLVEGRTLDRAIAAAGDAEQRLALLPHVIAVAEALAYAHGQRIIHRDLKPANVLIGSFGETVVIDWGLARRLDAEDGDPLARAPAAIDATATHDGALIGTPAYMSPEQAAGDDVDERADVYAIGAMLYQVLSGKRPFADATTLDEILERVQKGELRRLEELAPDLPGDLVAIAGKAMATNPDERYPTASALAIDLERYAAGQLVTAHRYTTAQLVRRWLRRRKGAVTVAAAALAALAVFGVIAVRQIVKERDAARVARDDAEQKRGEAERSRAEADARLGEQYFEQARLELVGGHPGRALPMLVEARRYGAAGPAVDFVAARAAEAMAPIAARLPVVRPVIDVRWTGTAAQLVLSTGDGVEMRTIPDGARRWRVKPPPDPGVGRHPTIAATAVSADGGTVAMGTLTGALLLERASGRQVMKLVRPAPMRRVNQMVFSPDGRRLAMVVDIGTGDAPGPAVLDLWDVGGASLLHTRTLGSNRAKWKLRFSPDGKWLVSFGPTNPAGLPPETAPSAVLRDAITGEPVRELCAANALCDPVLFSPDGTWVLALHDQESGAPGGSARILAVPGGAELAVLRHPVSLYDAAISADGRSIATSSTDGTVALWDRGGRRLGAIGLGEHVTRVAFAAGGRLIASLNSGPVVLVDTTSMRVVNTIVPSTSTTSALELSADGRWMWLGGTEHDVEVVDLRIPPEEIQLAVAGARTRRAYYAPDGGWLATNADDGELRIHDPATGAIQRRIAAHQGMASTLEIARGGAWLITGGGDGRVVIWDRARGTAIRELVAHGARVRGATLAPDGRRLATAGEDGLIRWWNAESGELERTFDMHARRGDPKNMQIMAIRWSPDGRYLASLDYDAWGVIIEAASGRTLGEIDVTGGLGVDLCFTPDSTGVAVARRRQAAIHGVDGQIKLALDGGGDAEAMMDCEFSPDGKRLLMVGMDRRLRVWDAATGRLLAGAVADAALTQATWRRDGAIIAGAGVDHRVYIWEAATGRELARRTMQDEAYWVQFAPDGRQLAIGTLSAAASLWNLPPPPPPDRIEWLARCRSGWRLEAGGLIPSPRTCEQP